MSLPEQKKLTPFDFLESIQATGKNLIIDEETEKQYNPYIVNKGLSFGADTIIHANEMNSRPHIPKIAQNFYLINNIVKRKRYNKWIKSELNNDLELVKQYYGYSKEKAKQALSILNQDQLDTIKQKLEKGGRR